MNWGALMPALGTLGGVGGGALGAVLAPATFGASIPAAAALGGTIGGAAGAVGGQFMPKDMPPPPTTQLPGQKAQLPASQQTSAMPFMQNLAPGQGGFLKRPFVG